MWIVHRRTIRQGPHAQRWRPYRPVAQKNQTLIVAFPSRSRRVAPNARRRRSRHNSPGQPGAMGTADADSLVGEYGPSAASVAHAMQTPATILTKADEALWRTTRRTAFGRPKRSSACRPDLRTSLQRRRKTQSTGTEARAQMRALPAGKKGTMKRGAHGRRTKFAWDVSPPQNGSGLRLRVQSGTRPGLHPEQAGYCLPAFWRCWSSSLRRVSPYLRDWTMMSSTLSPRTCISEIL